MKFRHLFLDSRYRTSGSDSDFCINLSETVETEEGARCYVGGVSFANVFYTIEEGLSDIWYVEVSSTSIGLGPGAYGLKLAYGNYGGTELAAEMQTRLRSIDGAAQVTYISKTGRIQINMSGGRTIKVWSDQELTNPSDRAFWLLKSPTFHYDINNPNSIGEVLRATPRPPANAYLSELIQLQPYNVLYLYSSLTTFDGIDSTGRSGIIARIPVEKTYGYVVFFQGPFLEQGWFDVGKLSFRNLRFSLRNSRGAVVPLHGSHLSVHLIFE